MTDLYLRQSLHFATLSALTNELAVVPGFVAWIDGYGRYIAVPSGTYTVDGYHVINGKDGVQWIDESVLVKPLNLSSYTKKTYVDGYISNYTRKIYVDGYVANYTTKEYVDGYLSNYTRKTYVDGYISNYTTKNYVGNYINSSIISFRNIDTQEWATAGSYTWTKPAGCTMVDVLLVGGGGGGSSGMYSSGTYKGGGGGGSGMLARYLFKASDLPSTVSVVVGAGGVGGIRSYTLDVMNSGSDGYQSAFGWLVASGGIGGIFEGGSGYAGGGGGGTNSLYTSQTVRGGGGIGIVGHCGCQGDNTQYGSGGLTWYLGGSGGSSNIRLFIIPSYVINLQTISVLKNGGCKTINITEGFCGGGAVGIGNGGAGGIPYGYGSGGSGGSSRCGASWVGGGGGGDGYNPFATRTAGPAGNAGENAAYDAGFPGYYGGAGGAGRVGYAIIRSW